MGFQLQVSYLFGKVIYLQSLSSLTSWSSYISFDKFNYPISSAPFHPALCLHIGPTDLNAGERLELVKLTAQPFFLCITPNLSTLPVFSAGSTFLGMNRPVSPAAQKLLPASKLSENRRKKSLCSATQ